jgi:anhydro-N-acetylmuramic acid kinase
VKVAGVMSGTSLDGIDVAVVEMPRIRTLAFRSTPYPEAVRTELLSLAKTTQSALSILEAVQRISSLNYRLAELYAKAIRRLGPVDLIGCHGQTVYHEGGRHTLQLGEPAVIAERTGIPVVSNFRARDIAAGGQGAPLVPYVDYLLFRHPKRTRVALNIGGIANITVVPAGASPRQVIAFDTGPGNMVIDALVRDFTKGRLNYDRGGKIAQAGNVNVRFLDELLRDTYYRLKPPKSAGREQYGADFVARFHALPRPDAIATATVLTAATIARSVQSYRPAEIIVSGGGVHNPQIIGHLAGFLPGVALASSTDYGVHADAKEAVAFAVLAYESWRGRASNLPSATGAKRAVVLGSVTS